MAFDSIFFHHPNLQIPYLPFPSEARVALTQLHLVALSDRNLDFYFKQLFFRKCYISKPFRYIDMEILLQTCAYQMMYLFPKPRPAFLAVEVREQEQDHLYRPQQYQ